MIDVLLATYRPNRRFLEEQISSILEQKGVQVNILSREDDDGLGACFNFARLLDSSTADYVAFSDQDDVWKEEKLARSMERMKALEAKYGKDVPLLVFTDAEVVDSDLRVLDRSLFRRTKINPYRTSPEQLILQNAGTGNTMLFNAALREKAKPIPQAAFMHDHWIALVASVFGKIACFEESTLLYRQHGKNVFGGAKVCFRYYVHCLKNGFSALRQKLYSNIRQAEAFAACYPDAPECFRACVGLEGRNWLMRRWQLLRYGIFKNGFIRNIGVFFVV